MQNLKYTRKKSSIKLKQMILDEVRSSENLKDMHYGERKESQRNKMLELLISTHKKL